MEKQDQYFDKAGRLSKEDEMMLAQPNKDMSCAIGMADPTSTMVSNVALQSWIKRDGFFARKHEES